MSAKEASQAMPYAGLRVIDLSQGIAGPSCGSLLARQGADVIKVEPPAGDWGRLMGDGREGLTPISIGANVGKRALCVDATSDTGKALLLRLIAEADIVIESFRPGVMEALGLAYETTSATNLRLIQVSINGFGSSGPYRDRPGSDSVLQAISGMMAMNRDSAGSPRRIGMMIVDAACGVYAAQSVGGALFQRTRTGEGARIEVSLLEVVASLQTIPIIEHSLRGSGDITPATVPSGTFRTQDGYINVVALRNEMFFRLARALSHDEWTQRDEWSTNERRLRHANAINEAIAEVLVQDSTAHWITRLQEHDVLCAAVNDYDGFVSDPQVSHVGIFQRSHIGEWRDVPIAGVPGVSAIRDGGAGRAPRQGEHSREVLAGIGLSDAEIDALIVCGVVRESAPQCRMS
ncbi:CaiB/BaiF CoA transferase family protein [Paraburkholderia dilworthii]|uniref:CoA transferase n=1 Tax=Paraburkholderia dilworthii TaxID=948106 RepID=A0ABW9D3B3_9BURK